MSTAIYRIRRGHLERKGPDGAYERVTEANDASTLAVFVDMGGDLLPDGHYILDCETAPRLRLERGLDAFEVA